MRQDADEVVSDVLRLGRKTVAAGFGLGVVASALYLARRSSFAQRRAMLYKLRKHTSQQHSSQQQQRQLQASGSPSASQRTLSVRVDRGAELSVLRHQLTKATPKLSIITGPEASGKTLLCNKALEDVRSVLHLDLAKEQVSSGAAGATDVLDHLVRKTGYYMPTNVLADIGLVQAPPQQTGSGVKSASRTRREVELALRHLEAVLASERAAAGVPCIFIDALELLSDSALRSNDFRRLVMWCMHVTDAGVANVVLVAQDSELQVLDHEHQSFQAKRMHFPIDYALVRPELVKVALRRADEGRAIFDGQEEAKLLCAAFGGQLRDMEKAIDFADNGLSIRATVSRMVTETAHFVQNTTLEPLLAEVEVAATSDRTALREAYKRYLRCWRMLELFAEADAAKATEESAAATSPMITQDRLMFEVFEQHGHEMDDFVDKGVLRYAYPPLGSDKAHEVTLTPLSPRVHCAFRQLVNKPGLCKVALDFRKQLARMDIEDAQATLQQRMATLQSVQALVEHERGPGAFEQEMNEMLDKLRAFWEDYDSLAVSTPSD